MLSVAKLTPGQETYYERSVAAGIDDYYAGRGESPGIWVGRAAAELGLEGVVARRPAWSADPRRSPPLRRATAAAAPEGSHDHRRANRSCERQPDDSRRRRSGRSPASTWCSPSPRASASCTPSATTRPGASSTRRMRRPGRPRSTTSRTRPASSGAARAASSASAPRGFVAAAYQHRTAARRTRTCTPT